MDRPGRRFGITTRGLAAWAAFSLVLVGACGPPPRRPPSTEIRTGTIEASAHRAYRRLTESLAIDTRSVSGRTIVVDPGHGGGYRGSTGVGGTTEADVNLAVGLFLWGLLADAGANVHLTRTADRDFVGGELQPPAVKAIASEPGPAGNDVPALASPESLRSDLAARTALANAFSPDLFLSIHHNADASGDTTRDQTLTFYRLGDPGASLDAAQAIHRHLMRNLGTASGQVMPGNYHVLRNSNAGAAVLGEPSFLTNPIFEDKLVHTDRVELEATAYFLGIVDYFARGTARVTVLAPGDTTIDAATVELRARFRGSPIDPATVEFSLDGDRFAATAAPSAAAAVAGEAAEVAYAATPPGPLGNGPHRLSVSARCLGGNAVPAISAEFEIRRPAAEIRAEPWPPWNGRERPGPLGVRVAVHDRLGFPVADSTAVELTAPRSAVSRTRGGEAAFQIEEPIGAGGTWRVRSGAAEASAPVVMAGAPPAWSGQLRDARSGRPIEGAEIRDGAGGPLLGRTAAEGGFGVRAPGRELVFSAPGYLPEFLVGKWTEPVMSPALAGVLHDRRIAVDAAGGGSEPLFVSPTGVRASDTALDIARRLAVELRRSGALPGLTRFDDRTLPPMARIEEIERVGAEWVVIIGAEGPGRVGHYPGSERGVSLATAIAREVEAEVGLHLPVGPVVNPFLQQTSMPAVELMLPVPADAAGEEQHLDLDFRRRVARALLLALAEEAGLDLGTQGTALLTSPTEHVLLDGATVLPTTGRSLLLRAVEPLPAQHRAATLDMTGRLGEGAIFSVGPSDTVRLGLR